MRLAELSNEALLSELHSLVGQRRVLLARLLAHLCEVEERRLDSEVRVLVAGRVLRAELQ